MSHTHLLLEKYFLKCSLKGIKKKFKSFFFLNLYYYVKVYVKDLKVYVILKSFEVYL
jgi:hypothetical protein